MKHNAALPPSGVPPPPDRVVSDSDAAPLNAVSPSTRERRRGVLLRIARTAKRAILPTLRTARFILPIFLFFSILPFVLTETGLFTPLSQLIQPILGFFGLPGEALLPLCGAGLVNLYAAVAALGSMDFSMRELLILAGMMSVAHALVPEAIALKKAASSFLPHLVISRLIAACILGWILNLLLPHSPLIEIRLALSPFSQLETAAPPFAPSRLLAAARFWSERALPLLLQVLPVLFLSQFLRQFLDEFKLLSSLGRLCRLPARVCALPQGAAESWAATQIAGPVYAAVFLSEAVRTQQLSPSEADLCNQHAALSHALIEEALLLATLAVPLFWTLVPRLLTAIIATWIERLRRILFRHSFRVRIGSSR